jgi:DHA2 family multidrug resistance protein-like MFS transporter
MSITRAVTVGRGRWWALGALGLSGLVIALDTTVLVTALPTLSAKLGATTSQLQWISAAYTLALAGLLLPAGVLGDRFGRKRLLVVGLLVFGAASVVASQMTTANGLILMRAVMGVGGAIILPLSLSILPAMFTPAERPRAIAVTAASAFVGLPFGPLVAGWLLTHYAWGSVFLINAPVIAVAVAGVWLLVPESRDPEAPPLDWVGAVLAVTGVSALVYGIIEEPANGWSDARVLASLVGGAAVLAAYALVELRRRTPLVDLRLFRDRRFTWSTVAFVAVGFALTGLMFVLAPYLQVVMGNDAQGTGLRLIPMIGGLMLGAIPSDRLTARLGTKAMVAGGMVVTSAGVVLLSRADVDTGYGMVAAALAVIGLGMGFAMPPALDAVIDALPAGQTGAGSALTRALQQIGASFGVAILGSVLNSAYRTDLSGHVAGLPAPVRDAAQGSVAVAAAVAQHLPGPAGGALVRAAREAYVSAMAEVLLVSAGLLLAVAVLVALFLPSRAAAVESPAETPAGEASPAARLA